MIGQLPSSDFGLFVWPSALLLSEFLWQHRSQLPGMRIVELGAGVGLPGILAAKLGARVVLTDRDALPVLENLRQNCKRNGVSCKVCALAWGTVTESMEAVRAEGVDLVMGADCVYSREEAEGLLATVSCLVSGAAPTHRTAHAATHRTAHARSRPPAPSLLLAYQERGSGYSFSRLARKWGVSCRLLPPPAQAASLSSGGGGRGGAEVKLLLFSSTHAQGLPAAPLGREGARGSEEREERGQRDTRAERGERRNPIISLSLFLSLPLPPALPLPFLLSQLQVTCASRDPPPPLPPPPLHCACPRNHPLLPLPLSLPSSLLPPLPFLLQLQLLCPPRRRAERREEEEEGGAAASLGRSRPERAREDKGRDHAAAEGG